MTDPKPASPATDEEPPEKKECQQHCWGGRAWFRVCIICGAPDKERMEKPVWP